MKSEGLLAEVIYAAFLMVAGIGVYKIAEQQSVVPLLRPTCVAQENQYIDGQTAERWIEQQTAKKK